MFSIIAGLGAALCYGISDFAGGRASHRIAVVQVLVISEVIGALILWGIAYTLGEPLLATTNVAVAIAAGLCGAIGVAALYLGIAAGHTAITVPVSAVLATFVAVLYGIGAQGIPSVTVMAGIGLGIAAINHVELVRWATHGLSWCVGRAHRGCRVWSVLYFVDTHQHGRCGLCAAGTEPEQRLAGDHPLADCPPGRAPDVGGVWVGSGGVSVRYRRGGDVLFGGTVWPTRCGQCARLALPGSHRTVGSDPAA